ncbi:VRR-NUC domain-containing protein [Pseudoduganella buxea]|uniref:phosphodiesterase I n=1 Tax=Pseudoduganella buxea TaxID=1949069 RepID=A0A6I3SU61_9BURK|nr:VRR-NUC domain-containing protein [Pseudoduganella buxea]MTV52720.1 VRR-NUC domain-containing protein [Pseudoduganella buxea]GGC18673.1 Fanconi-associated nuclease [Pseudoduganella buxea]
MRPVLENPLYYLDNFHRVLAWIGERYSDLLDDEEQGFLARFPTLPQNARALFVRMVMRKGRLFRASKLAYDEIGCPRAAAAPLAELGWLEADPAVTPDELFDLLLKAELAQVLARLCPDAAPARAARKGELLDALRAARAQAQQVSQWWPDGEDAVWHIAAQPLCDRLRLIFFGNYHQDWTEFVLSDLGVFRFEKVDFADSARAFRTRRDIDEYLALHACRERFGAGEDPLAVLADVPPASSDNEWLCGRRHKLLFQMGQQMEKLRDWPGALAVYGDCGWPGARARIIRVLEKDEQHGPAWELLQRAQAAPESEAERQQLLRIAPRLARRLGHPVGATRRAAVDRLDLCLPLPGPDWWVEGVVRDHLASAEAPVFYVENTLINSLFGLLCWDAIFAAVPGAFFHPFHHGPADLHSADFGRRRADRFAACFARLGDGSYRDAIRANRRAKEGISSPFVHWGALDDDLLELALDCIPAPHLLAAFQRILADIKENRTGFPDLIRFWPAERRYQMIEVKGPGDRLQDNQLRWIDYCARHRMPVSVCYLQWQESVQA